MRQLTQYQEDMRPVHSRVAFAALDKVIAKHYLMSVAEKEDALVINFSDVLWARDAGFSLSVIRAALNDVANGMSNFPDALVFNQLLQEIGE